MPQLDSLELYCKAQADTLLYISADFDAIDTTWLLSYTYYIGRSYFMWMDEKLNRKEKVTKWKSEGRRDLQACWTHLNSTSQTNLLKLLTHLLLGDQYNANWKSSRENYDLSRPLGVLTTTLGENVRKASVLQCLFCSWLKHLSDKFQQKTNLDIL